MNANVKRVAGFVFCRNAFTQRNVTSIGLVAMFFLVYVLAGGKITTQLPNISDSAGLAPRGPQNEQEVLEQIEKGGPVAAESAPEAAIPDLTEQESKAVLGLTTTQDRAARENVRAKMGSLFTDEEREELENQPVNKEGLVQGGNFTNRREQWKLEQSEKKPTDSLSIIEERLKIKKKH